MSDEDKKEMEPAKQVEDKKEMETAEQVEEVKENVESSVESPQEKADETVDEKALDGAGKESIDESPKELVERVVKISRVSKVVKGGKNFSFNALVIVGDAHGSVGIGFGKSNEVVEAIKKGSAQAKRSLFKINMRGDTIPHEIIGRFKATRVLLKPAGAGTGVIAGGPVRALCDAAGIKNILTKSLGSRNAINVVKATVNGFERFRLKRRG